MNKFTLKFELIDGDAISEEWKTERNLKELNKHISQMLMLPWYTINESNITINVSHVKYFTITEQELQHG